MTDIANGSDIALLRLTIAAQSKLVESALAEINRSATQQLVDQAFEKLRAILLEINELCRTSERLIENLKGGP